MEPIITLFDELEDNEVRYCVLRNYEGIRDGEIDGDIDIAIDSSSRVLAEEVLKQNGFIRTIGGSTRHSSYSTFLPGDRRVIQVDVAWDGPGYNGIPIVNSDLLFEHRQLNDGFWVPRDEELVVQLLFHSILNKNRFKPLYQQEIDERTSKIDREVVYTHAESMFGTTGKHAVDLILDSRFDAAVNLKWKLILENIRRRPSVFPTLVWNLLIYHQFLQPLRKLNKRSNPFSTAPVVALLGPDGSGKTTIAQEVVEVLRDNGIDANYARLGVYNDQSWPVQRLNDIYEFVTGSTTDDQSNRKVEGGEKQCLPPRKSFFKACIHFCDIATRIISAQARSTDVLIADRYIHDLIIHDKTGPLRQLFRFFKTDPFYGFVLETDPSIIAARSEYDEESVREMCRRLEEVDFERIDVSQEIDEVVNDVLAGVFSDGKLLAQLK